MCQGNQYQYCGAGNRLELYKKTSQVSSSVVVSTTTTKSSSTLSTVIASSTTTLKSSTTTAKSSTTTIKSSTTTSPSAAPTLQIVPSVGLYNYHGCWTETQGARALAAAFYPSDTLTIEECVASCSGYKYAGAEYGRECFCADTFTAGSELVPNTDCYFTCAGSQYEYCGAGNRLSVYIKNGTSSGGASSSTTLRLA